MFCLLIASECSPPNSCTNRERLFKAISVTSGSSWFNWGSAGGQMGVKGGVEEVKWRGVSLEGLEESNISKN